MSAADVEPRTAAVIFQIKQHTSGYHVGWVQAVKDIKDPKTKEVEDGLFVSQVISYQIHTRENKKTGAKVRRIKNERGQGNFAVAINKIKSGCFWGFISDEVWARPARRVHWLCLCPWGLFEFLACYARPESQAPPLSLGTGKRMRHARSPPPVPISIAGEEVEESEREVKEATGEAEGDGTDKEEEEGVNGKEDEGPNSKEEGGGSGGGRGRR